eukprot:TRINITY_DN9906_c0_g1_i10.p1 TRINITY_DN9906_c0_g1~~TRINITY_DN9906_c0_g1_i10.p1  ORF type:complete len:143 (+),score=26.03 TRINITY_DN9906_c0_g1_i10:192-620(+)
MAEQPRYCQCGFKPTQCKCSRTARKPSPQDASSLSSSDVLFASWVINELCSNPGPGSSDGRIQQDIATLTKALTNEPPKAEANLYRKQHGNVKQIFMTGKFELLLSLNDSILGVAPPASLEVALESGVLSLDDFSQVKECRQ